MATFNERIWQLYEDARDRDYKIGRKGFAKMLGVRKGQLDGWLDNGVAPHVEVIKQIARNTGISVLWLIGETEDKEYPSFQMTGLPPEEEENYLIFLEFLRFKHRRKAREAKLSQKTE